MIRRIRIPALAAVAALALAATSTGAAFAFFRASPTVANTFTSKQIFPGVRTTAPYDIRDAAGGAAPVNTSTQPDFADGITFATGAWGSAFSTTRYIEFNYNGPLPTPGSVTSPSFTFRFADPSTGTVCFYFDLRRSSDGALISTYGSAAAPVACQTGTTLTTSTTALSTSDVPTNAVANDLRVRIYGKESSAAAGVTIDQATVSLTQWSLTSILHPLSYVDNTAGTTPTTYPEPLVPGGTTYNTLSWPSAFSTSAYVQFTFPAYVPSGAVVTSATLTKTYKINGTGQPGTTCYYITITVNGTTTTAHGSSASPYACTTSVTPVTDVITLPEITTGAQADTVVLKIFATNTRSKPSGIDQLTLSLNYYLT